MGSLTTGLQLTWKVCGKVQTHNSFQGRYINMLRESHALCTYRKLAAARKEQ